ncbi:caspase family protein [Bradyrhizobium sp. 1]|uniref:caspase family protein n=1 Tax=Bradyrhizobium sp. 1 TaxID=241591 RepID=UPI001FF7B8CF|nr:caspase family protein [Bradyrhizobium sp. 1]MCK1391006.1 SEL1-like repeat protein [Bradyrhizobium sp. 1]
MRLPGLLIAVAAILLGTDAKAAGGRVALVVGNSNYLNAPRIVSPVNDADDIATTLVGLGFDVDLRKDATAEDLRTGIRAFTEKSAGADISIFYFAGYSAAAGVGGHLIPVDAGLPVPSSRPDTIPLPIAIAGAARARRLGLVILDAMRENPFPAKPDGRNGGDRVAAPAGAPSRNTLVFFPTEPGRTAEEGEGRNSVFAAALLKYLPQADLEINFVFRNIRDDVRAATQQKQTPYMYGQLSKDRIYLNPVKQAAIVQADPTVARRCDSLASALADARKHTAGQDDVREATKAAEAAAACSDAVNQSPGADQLHYQLGRSLFAARDFTGALASYRTASELGNARAIYELGWMYDSGNGVEKDPARARFYYEMAAEKKIAPAIFSLGMQQERGIDAAGDPAKAYALYKRAADLGDPAAINKMGELAEKGLGIPQNLKQARAFYEKSATMGALEAMVNLARCNANGIGGRQDLAAARRLLAKAAEAGSADARRILAHIGDARPK